MSDKSSYCSYMLLWNLNFDAVLYLVACIPLYNYAIIRTVEPPLTATSEERPLST